MSFLYLAVLLFSIAGLTTLDFRFKLALGKNLGYLCFILIPTVFFLIWDIAGINSGIFFRGGAEHILGVQIYEEMPIEEIFFLILLSYSALLLLKASMRLGTRGAKK